MMKKTMLIVALLALCMTQGCGRMGQPKDDGIPTFEEAQAEVPELVSPEMMADLIKSDTTHWKIVYVFSDVCKPCLQHLRDDIAVICSTLDTSMWRVYVVGTFVGLHHANATCKMDDISYYANRYHERMKEYGIDTSFLYMVYSPDWERGKAEPHAYLALRTFRIDEKGFFWCEGEPQYWRADPQNRLQLKKERLYQIKDNDTIDRGYFLVPEDYSMTSKQYFDTTDFYKLETVVAYRTMVQGGNIAATRE